MMTQQHAVAIVLAAGASRRLGRPKQLVKVASGETLIRHTVSCFTRAGVPVVVVTGAYRQPVERELEDLPCTSLHNAAWEEGMGSSIRCGIAEAARQGYANAILSVVDQPHLSPLIVEQLLETSREQPGHIVTCVYGNGVHGVPTLFPRTYFAALGNLRGDAGARSVVRDEEVAIVTFAGGEADVDEQGDLG